MRSDDGQVIRVFNEHVSYQDVEREIALSRRAQALGAPTAVPSGIVHVGNRYGTTYELADAETLSTRMAHEPGRVGECARIMAATVRQFHAIEVGEDDVFRLFGGFGG